MTKKIVILNGVAVPRKKVVILNAGPAEGPVKDPCISLLLVLTSGVQRLWKRSSQALNHLTASPSLDGDFQLLRHRRNSLLLSDRRPAHSNRQPLEVTLS